jgi:regulator of cell morphogenesis and NO signaling
MQTNPMTTDLSPRAARLEASQTVNEVLRLHPRTVAVFNALAIDACCGGERTLAEAAQEDGVQLDALLAALLAALRWSPDDGDEAQA